MKEPTRRERKKLRERFLEQNPFCLFCGGVTPPTTEDHIPPRSVFEERKWPEGYSFPACAKCNSATRLDELILAMISRVYPDPEPNLSKSEIEKIFLGVWKNFPGLLEDMRPSSNRIRNFLQQRSIPRPEGLLRDYPLLSVRDERINKAIMRSGYKIACALHWKHTDKIIPLNGVVFTKWFTNVQLIDGELSIAAASFLQSGPKMERARKNLNDQFGYLYGASSDGEVGSYISYFRQSLAIVSFVYLDEKKAPQNFVEGRFKPKDLSTPTVTKKGATS